MSRTTTRSRVSESSSKSPFRTSLSSQKSGPRYGNMMYDPRVIRGSTHVLRTQIESKGVVDTSLSQDTKPKKKKPKRSRPLPSRARRVSSRIHSDADMDDIKAVAGRRHVCLQTDAFLEDILVDPRALDKSTAVQTDAFGDRPSTPLFIPQTSGPSVATQIEEGDLFEFDSEVRPIVDTMVCKLLTAAVEQLLEETEESRWQRHRHALEAKRLAIIAQCQALEQKERLREEQRTLRVEQENARLKAEDKRQLRVKAQGVAKKMIEKLETHVLELLEEKGYFVDPCEKAIANEILPDLERCTDALLKRSLVYERIVNDTVDIAVNSLLDSSKRGVANAEYSETRLNDERKQQRQCQGEMKALKIQFGRVLRKRALLHESGNDPFLKEHLAEVINLPFEKLDEKDDESVAAGDNSDDDSDASTQKLNGELEWKKQTLAKCMEHLKAPESVWRATEGIVSLLNENEMADCLSQFVAKSAAHEQMLCVCRAVINARNTDAECLKQVADILSPVVSAPISKLQNVEDAIDKTVADDMVKSKECSEDEDAEEENGDVEAADEISSENTGQRRLQPFLNEDMKQLHSFVLKAISTLAQERDQSVVASEIIDKIESIIDDFNQRKAAELAARKVREDAEEADNREEDVSDEEEVSDEEDDDE